VEQHILSESLRRRKVRHDATQKKNNLLLGESMLTRSELPENPVVLAVQDADGRKHTITTERVRGGKIRMTCTCDAARTHGWCRHQIDLLCMRYEAVPNRSEDAEFHFEDIVMGTPLADTADEVDVALADYDTALRSLEAPRPAGFDGGHLRAVAELASDLAEAARQLDHAVGRFRKQLESGSAHGAERVRIDPAMPTLR
jgi:hypothetical protein